jgi:hypothetical protein
MRASRVEPLSATDNVVTVLSVCVSHSSTLENEHWTVYASVRTCCCQLSIARASLHLFNLPCVCNRAPFPLHFPCSWYPYVQQPFVCNLLLFLHCLHTVKNFIFSEDVIGILRFWAWNNPLFWPEHFFWALYDYLTEISCSLWNFRNFYRKSRKFPVCVQE